MKPIQDKINYKRILVIEKINKKKKKVFNGEICITDIYILGKP